MLPNTQRERAEGLAPGAHFGSIQSVHTMGSLIVAESEYRPFFQTPHHWHETASFTMVFRGSYLEEFSKTQFDCQFGSALYRPAGEIHRDRISSAGAHCLMVELPNEWLRRIAVRGIGSSGPRHVRNYGDFPARIRKELAVSDNLSPMVVEALVMELACHLERNTHTGQEIPRWVRQLRERIEAEFANLPSLETLAKDLGVHPAHIARSFRQHFGCTIGEYARRRKISFCCEQLRNKTPTLCELAADAGFSSQAHLTRMFKLHTGMTPGEFRRTTSGKRNSSAKMRIT
jgi:AraC family transcriptional regulator